MIKNNNNKSNVSQKDNWLSSQIQQNMLFSQNTWFTCTKYDENINVIITDCINNLITSLYVSSTFNYVNNNVLINL